MSDKAASAFARLSASQKKMLASTCMTVTVVALWLCRLKPWSGWALGAMLASWVADAFLAKYPPVLGRIKQGFFVGAILFALAHVGYAAASVMILRSLGLPFSWWQFSAVMAIFALCVLAHFLLFARSSKHSRGFTLAACSYLLVVGAMSALAVRVCAETAWRVWLLPIGACLFFLSDCILVVREYRRAHEIPAYHRAIWATYMSGQLLLQLGLWLA